MPQFGYDQRWNFGFQREIANRMSLEMNYVGTKGSESAGVGEHQHSQCRAPAIFKARRPYPRFGNMSIHSQARSTEYHALQTKFQKRTSGGYWYLVSHTWSQTLTTQPAPGIGGNFTYDTGPAGIRRPAPSADELRRGTAVRQRQAVPRRRRHVRRTALLGGWQAQSIVNYRSGLPFTPSVSRDVANTGAGGQRPNQIGAGELEDPTIDAWFDKTAFVVPPDFTFGNSRRGILRGDHQWNVDFSLFKRFSVERIEVARVQG